MQTPLFEKMTDDPNVRLALYRKACDTILSQATLYGPTVISPFWIDVLLSGVQDMWSCTRRECVQCIQKLAYLLAPEDRCFRSSYNSDHESMSVLLRKPSAAISRMKNSSSPVKLAGMKKTIDNVNVNKTEVPYNDWCRELASKLLYKWKKTQGGSANWYKREGLLRVFKIYCNASSTLCLGNAEGKLWQHAILFRVALPALNEAQLPVREEAASLVCIISQQDSLLCSFIFDRMAQKLRSLTPNQKIPTLCTDANEKQTHDIEGYFMVLIQLFKQDAHCSRKGNMYPLLIRYASHPAASVRQYVAEALRPPCKLICARLMKCLSEGSQWASSHIRNDWQEAETVLMALQSHFLYYLRQGKDHEFNLEGLISATGSQSLDYFVRSCFDSLLAFSSSARFELSRMGRQVIPLFLQLWIRFTSTPKVVLNIVQELVMIRERNTGTGSTASGLSIPIHHNECDVLYDTIVPLLWWYLTLRSATRMVGNEKNWSGLESDDVKHFLNWLGSNTNQGKSALYSTVVLIIVAYLQPILSKVDVDTMERHLLERRTWETILRDPSAMAYLHFGIDFVTVMRWRGRDVRHLLPVWVEGLGTTQTHQQCILITMIREALYFQVEEKSHESGPEHQFACCRLFRFAYHDAFAAPAMLDGGEETPLGYTWLKTYFPTEEKAPTCNVVFGTPTGQLNTAIEMRAENSIIDLLTSRICNGLYLSPIAEPEILHETRLLMIAMATIYHRQDCFETLSRCLLMRLDRVCPGWENKENNTTNRNRKACDWDASDDDGNTTDDPGRSTLRKDEIQDAGSVLAHMMQNVSNHGQKKNPQTLHVRLAKLLAYQNS